MSKKKNPSIKCNVETCKHNDCSCGYCDLDEIQVSCTCDHTEVDTKESTICESFECDCDKKKEA